MGEGGCLCQWELKAPTDRSRSDCVHEQVAKRIANVRFTIFFSPPSLDGAIIADSKRRNYHESVKDCKAQKK